MEAPKSLLESLLQKILLPVKRKTLVPAACGLAMLCASGRADAQSPLTEAQVVAAALANPVNTQAAALGVRQQQRLLNGIASYDNLQITAATDPYDPAELGIDQVFDFPTAYGKRRALQRATIGLAEGSLAVSQYEVKRRARETYLQLQFLAGRSAQLRYQDSLYESIAAAAGRTFEAGQINALEKQFAENRYYNVHNTYLRVQAEYTGVQEQLRVFAGLDAPPVPLAWPASVDEAQQALSEADTATIANPTLALLQREVDVSRRQVDVARTDALPGFVTGVGIGLEREHRNRAVGVRAGITLPIFFGQTRARIEAARIGVQVAEAQARAGAQSIAQQTAVARAAVLREGGSIRYYQTVALPKAEEIITTARRLFAAGQISYTEYLRNAAEAFDNKLAYLQALRDYYSALIELQYLTGTL